MKLRLRVGVIMKQRDMSIAELAEKADIAPNTARSLARGFNERVDFAVLNKVARALEVRPMELLEEVENGPGQLRGALAVS